MQYVKLVGTTNQSMTPLQFEEKIIIRLEEVNNPEPMDLGLSRVFLNQDIGGVAPT